MAKELEDLVMSEGPETNAALLAEPMQSGGGAIHPPWDYWPAMQAVIRQFDNKTKQFRGIATRYEKNPLNFLAAVKLVSTRIWPRSCESTA